MALLTLAAILFYFLFFFPTYCVNSVPLKIQKDSKACKGLGKTVGNFSHYMYMMQAFI